MRVFSRRDVVNVVSTVLCLAAGVLIVLALGSLSGLEHERWEYRYLALAALFIVLAAVIQVRGTQS